MQLWLRAPPRQVRARPALGHGAAQEAAGGRRASLQRRLRRIRMPVCCAGGAVQTCQGTSAVQLDSRCRHLQ